MNLSGFPSLNDVGAISCGQTAISIANTQPVTMFLGRTNNLTSAQVDAILVALDGNGLNGGTVDLSGQTPIAPPTATGLAAMANLIGKAWTVTVDKPTWAPASEVGTWADSGGPAFGNLAAFQAGADMATVSQLTFGATGNLTSLTGLQGLPVLATLDVNTNALTTLDCSGLTALTTLDCSNNSLTSITGILTCTSLVSFDFHNNSLVSLDIHGLSNLTSFDETGNPSLISFDCHDCTSLPTIAVTGTGIELLASCDFSGCTSATFIDCGNNPSLTDVDITGCSSCTQFFSDNSPLTDAGFVGLATCTSLTVLDCTAGALTSLDASALLSVQYLSCGDNSLTSLNISTCTSLIAVACENNSLVSVSIPSLNITDLTCFGNTLTSLTLGASVLYSLVDAHDNLLNQAQVDSILSTLATNCLGNAGTFDLDTPATNASPTGGILNADYVALTGAGWTGSIN